ncbi:hypothetical protein QQF64_027394 [Cirrhinus molitorella]|uniref:FIIND domain-containing protein n=1 Tax=Cirrhinus molitorella TaxID=172907 RepID=A0ABR3NCA9_9TELE
MSLEGVLTTKLLLHECHFTWSLREEDFVLSDLLNRLEEQIELESDEQRVTRAYSSLGFVQFLYGNQQEALSNLQKSVQLANEYYKDSDEVLIVTYGDLAWLHYHMNEFSKCEDYLRELERIRRKFSEGFTYSVEVLREKGWTFLKFSYKYYNAAKECFRQALDMNPDDSDLNSGYAIVLYRTTKNTADSSDSPTTKQLEKAIKLDPDDAALLVLLALRMQHNRDDLKNAQLKVIKALVMSPENPHVIRYAAQFHRQLKKQNDAINLLNEALQATPNSAFIHHQLAMCYKSKKLSLEKTNGEAMTDKKKYEIQKYLHKCIHHLQKAISLKPSFVIAVADLALHYGQLGSLKAERLFEESFKMANNEKQHLQMVHCLYGQYKLYHKRSESLAIFHFMQGLRLQPKSERGKMCEENLKKIIKCRINRLKNLNDHKVCGIQGFIHEVNGEKVKAEEFYEKAQTNALNFGESLLTEMRIWLMSFSEPEKYVLNLIFDRGSYDEVGSGRLKIFKGSMTKKIVHLVDIDICNAKRILKWEKLTPGPHAILLTFSLHVGGFTDQTKRFLEDLAFLGEKFWNHVIVVFTEGDCSLNAYTGAQRSVLEWLLEKCGHKSYICGSAPETTERIELSERIQMMIRKNNSMHLVLPNISDGDSQSSSDILRKLDVKDHLFTPEVTIQDGQSKYRLQCSHAGWYHCDFTQIGFYMEKEGEVLYRTVLQDSDCPFPANYYQAGPVYDIKCVQGELSQLRLPHCETSIEDACHFMSVIHYSSQIVDILKPHNITSTHVTLSITGTSKFVLSKKFNFFKDHWSRILGQVMLFYIERTHRLHVFLEACNVDPREVKKDRKEYTLIQTSCQCILKNKCQYSMSCDSVEKHECSERLLSEIEPADTTLQLSDQWKHHFPTFDIKLPDDVMKVNLQLKKKNLKKGAFEAVWSRNITLTDYTAENRRSNLSTEEQCVSFLNNHRPELIQRIQLECKEARVTRAYSSLGFIQYLYGNQQEALANLQKSVEIAKEHYKDNDEVLIVTYGDLAWLHYHMNAFSKCEDYLRELERIHKNSDGFGYTVEVLREKGWTFLKFSYKYSHAAKACFRQALEINPDDGDLNAGYAIALYRTTKNIPDSSDSPTIKQLERAIELNKDDAVLLLLLALMLQHNKDDRTISETAQKKVTMALKMSPENPHVIRYTAKFFRQLGNMDIAINLLEDALQATPNSAFIHHQLALCYKNKKTFLERKHRMYGKAKFNVQESDEIHQYLDQCIYHLDRALFLKPSFVIATADLALHYGQLGSFKAESLFGEAFKMANNEKNYLQAVHCIYGQYQLYYQRSEPLAFHHFMQGLRLQPETELGMVCEKKLKIMMQYRIKWQNILDDGVVCGIQGFIHEVKGEKLKAEELYERALKNGLEFGK